jgi:hypothetical protein
METGVWTLGAAIVVGGRGRTEEKGMRSFVEFLGLLC